MLDIAFILRAEMLATKQHPTRHKGLGGIYKAVDRLCAGPVFSSSFLQDVLNLL